MFDKWRRRRAYLVGFYDYKRTEKGHKVGTSSLFYDSRSGEYVNTEPAWWAEVRSEKEKEKERKRALGFKPPITEAGTESTRSTRPVLTPFLPANEEMEIACDAVIDIGDRQIEPRQKPEKGTVYYSGYKDFWFGINRAKWPNAWLWCVKFAYSESYHKETKNTYSYNSDAKTEEKTHMNCYGSED